MLEIYRTNATININDFLDYAYLLNIFIKKIRFSEVEKVGCLFLNENKELIEFDIMRNGNKDSFFINYEDILNRSKAINAKSLILEHNHPGRNLSYASEEDINSFKENLIKFPEYNITLIDSVIISNNFNNEFTIYSLMNDRVLSFNKDNYYYKYYN